MRDTTFALAAVLLVLLSSAAASSNTAVSQSPQVGSSLGASLLPVTSSAPISLITSTTTATPALCPGGLACDALPSKCLTCSLEWNCTYGDTLNASCSALVPCIGNVSQVRPYMCRYCYQTEASLHVCTPNTACRARPDAVPATYTANCTLQTAAPLCLGRRSFPRRLRCDWSGGHRWSTTLVLSVTLGGVGADRFYLGQWREGIAKLFSFGGLGVWTLVDVVLVAIGYVGPEDGSLYIY